VLTLASSTGNAVAMGVGGVVAVLAVCAVFYAIGRGEDRDRASVRAAEAPPAEAPPAEAPPDPPADRAAPPPRHANAPRPRSTGSASRRRRP
jgi:hypothetical protein